MRSAIILALLFMPALALAQTTYYSQTNHFALKQGQKWTWEQVAKTPNIKWHDKKPQLIPELSYYNMSGEMGEYGSLSAQGSKAQPTIIHFNSSQSYKESDDGADVYTLNQLFKKSELTKVKSNCSVDANTGIMAMGEYQHFYKWQKKGYQPLYIGVRRFVAGTFSGGIIMNYILVKDFDTFNSNLITDLERYDEQGNDIVCRIIK